MPASAIQFSPHRFTRREYDELIARGAFADVRVELIDGVVVDVSPQGPQHAAVIQALTRWFGPQIGLLRVQLPVAADAYSEPEPDIALAAHDDATRHPETALLAVEVVVTQRREAEHKAAVYARAGIPEYWLVDVPRREVVVHAGPRQAGYERRVVRRGEDALQPPAALEATTVAELFRAAALDD
jgi:Uma2 family endonuclease